MCWTDWQTKCRKNGCTVNWYQHLQHITTVRTDLSSAGDEFCSQSKTHRACKEDRSFLPFRLNITLSCPLLSVMGSISRRCFENESPLILSKELFREASKTGLERRRKSSVDYPGYQRLFSRVQQVRRVRSDPSESAAEIGTLRFDDGDGDGNTTKAIGLISKITILHVHYAFLRISLPSLHDYDVKMNNFPMYRGSTQATTKFPLSFWTWIWFLGIQL